MFKISGLWMNEDRKGNTYLKGSAISDETYIKSKDEEIVVVELLEEILHDIKKNGGKYKFVALTNTFKEEEKHPDYNLFIADATPKEKQ